MQKVSMVPEKGSTGGDCDCGGCVVVRTGDGAGRINTTSYLIQDPALALGVLGDALGLGERLSSAKPFSPAPSAGTPGCLVLALGSLGSFGSWGVPMR
ncbi:hypothetical protein GQ607_009324 [Colletotrichum asianum]|uniref:Uncharacterized protein n=1 Tax=Colletotrichum asianum TaxID=702518 RepID=A0A8H3WCQ2_9PEZI|nr:hypothetical protein GQ607_009324 [Colletotrichum asianum]